MQNGLHLLVIIIFLLRKARDVFREVSKGTKRLRQKREAEFMENKIDFWGGKIAGFDGQDPAKTDKELREKLQRNDEIGGPRLEKVIFRRKKCSMPSYRKKDLVVPR